jgi:beta-phosphoglucomutase family hydrolase
MDWILTRERFDAILFDLDGVLTDTARIHAACWKRMFDAFLESRSEPSGDALRPFDIETDYPPYVDGKPRFDGVRDFLASRGIELPEGSPDDSPEYETVCGLGNRKNEMVNRAIAELGVDAYPSSVAVLRRIREEGVKTAVVSSSGNCAAVLEAAKIADLFDARVDGVDIIEQGLAGKPAPDSFLEGARRLGVSPERCAVVEDAISGVQAGRDGGFGLVIGVARKGDARALCENGADLVVADLGELLG